MTRAGREGHLYWRIACVLAGFIALAAVVPAGLTIWQQHDLLRGQIRSEGLVVAELATLAAAQALAGDDLDSLSILVATLTHDGPDVVEAVVVDRQGRVLADSRFDEERSTLPDLQHSAASTMRAEFVRDGDAESFRVTAPIRLSGEPWGSLRIVMSLESVHRALWASAWRTVLLGAVVLLLGLLAAGWLVHSIAAPLVRMMAFADEVRGGNLAVRVPVESKNEIGRLADTFNQMARGLEESRRERREYAATLERRVAERTAELAAARDAAEAGTRAKSAFLATMSHELRTPMNGVLGMTDLLADTPLTEDQTELVDTIRASGEQLLGVVNDILDYSKIEAGSIELEKRPFELQLAMEQSVDLVAFKAAEKSLEITLSSGDDVPCAIVGDEQRLRQILTNLLSNAVKFTEAGEINVHVEVDGHEDGRARLHFSVHDTGIGIPEEHQSRLFKRFSQTDASTTRRFGGTGLGLAISRAFAEMMDGAMWVESAAGDGATFHFTVLAETAPDFDVRRATIDPGVLAGRRVLIVDDNATNRRILIGQTRSWGLEPVALSGGTEALAAMDREASFDAAVLDLQMPDMDGVELGHRLRRTPAGAGLPLVLLSSAARIDPRGDHAGRGGAPLAIFAAILAKPARPAQLRDALAAALGGVRVETFGTAAGSEIDPRLARRLPLRILLAEDNPINQKVALKLLARMGYAADLARDGREALAALAEKTYDLVLMDVQMPEMDGLEATREIRRRCPPEVAPRIVAMTANAMREDHAECLAAGMDDVLTKPVTAARLAAALERCAPPKAPPAADLSPG